MVHVHKIKQGKDLDLDVKASVDKDRSNGSPITRKESPDDNEPDDVQNTSNSARTTSRRPATRSQMATRSMTTRSTNRRADSEGVSKKSPPKRARADSVSDEQVPKRPSPPSPPRRVHAPPPTAPAMGTPPAGQYTFLDSSASDGPFDRRGPRARAAPPIPVPNLTKKSRGRRVPTKPTVSEQEGAKPSTNRVYVCKVENCGKCFNRGEHLKRHIRSIHTYEKPFKCSHPSCDKYFNRHDNLLQHQKVHKDFSPSPSRSASPADSRSQAPDSPEVLARSLPFPFTQPNPPQYSSFTSYHSPISGSGASFTTNMAVSSLRTELPRSPVEERERPRHAQTSDDESSPTSHFSRFHARPQPTQSAGQGPSGMSVFQ